VFHREPDEQIGHNPAGGWMVVLLLALLLGETLTGIVDNNDVADEGPLTEIISAKVLDLITNLHALLWAALLVATLLHVTAIGVYAAAKGHNLLRPMVTGHKQFLNPCTPPRQASYVLALATLACSVAVTALVANLL
jgi:cytochrome b